MDALKILQERRRQLEETDLEDGNQAPTEPRDQPQGQPGDALSILRQQREARQLESERSDRRTAGGWARNIARAPIEGAAGATGGIVEGVGLDVERVRRELGMEPRAVDDIPTVQTGRSISEAGSDLADIDPDYEGTLAIDASRGAGSLATFGVLGLAGRGAGTATALARGRELGRVGRMGFQMAPPVGAAQSAGVSEAYNQAQQFMQDYPELAAEAGLDEDAALELATGGQPRFAGAVQVASVASLLRPLTGTLPQQVVRRMIETGFNEYVVENLGAAIQNNLRQSYDPDHPLWENIPRSGEAAGLGAAALALLFSPLSRRGANVSARGPSSTESVDGALLQALADEGIDVSMEDLVGGDQAVDLSALYEGEQEDVIQQLAARYGHAPDAETRMDPQGPQYGGLQPEAAGTVQPAQEPGSPQPFAAQRGLPGEQQGAESQTSDQQALAGRRMGLDLDTLQERSDAEEVRSDPRQPEAQGQVGPAGQEVGRPDLQQPAQARTEAGDAEALIEQAAAESETDPTPAQIESGNYRKGHLKLHGLDISIENPRGSVRRGTDAEGNAWETEMADHYGYIRRSEGADGDHVDVFLAENASDPERPVFVVDQVDPRTGEFDEHKVVLGARTPQEAEQTYLANYEDGWQGLDSVHGMTLDQFRNWLEDGDAAQLPAARMGEQDAHADAEYRSMVERSRRPEEELWAEAGDRISDQPVPRRPQPIDDPRLGDEDTRRDIEAMAARAGQAEEGGRMLKDERGRVTRTPHVPQEMWWPERPKGVTKRDMQQGVRKALAGEKVNANERRAVLFLLELSDIADVTNDSAEVQRFQEDLDQSLIVLDYFSDNGELVLADMLDSFETERAQFETERAEYERFTRGRAQAAEGAAGSDVSGRQATGDRGREGSDAADRGGKAAGTAREYAGADQGVTEAAEGERQELRLEDQTPDQLRAQDEAAQRREQEEQSRRQKEQVDAEVDQFELTGSDRVADANPAQMDLTEVSASGDQQFTPQEQYQSVIDDLPDAQIEVLHKEAGMSGRGKTAAQKRAELRSADEADVFPIYERLADEGTLPSEASPDRFEAEQDWDYSVANFPEPSRTVDANKKAGDFISLDEAKRRLGEWKAEAKRIGRDEDHSNEVVISLFDATGEISKPWREAGYDVRQYDIQLGHDLLEFFPMGDILAIRESGKTVVGVLAQPPCTCFASSGARWWTQRHDRHDRDMVDKMFGPGASRYFSKPKEYTRALVAATDTVIGEFPELQFWGIENPVGRIATEMGLPKPTLKFDPHVYGNPYTKRTQLWGKFSTDLPTANVEPTQGSLMHKLWSTAEKTGGTRSITPEGFAYAFFMANAPSARRTLEAAPTSGPIAALGFKWLPDSNTHTATVTGKDGRQHLFNVREGRHVQDGRAAKFRVTVSTRFPGTSVTGAPTREFGRFNSEADVAAAIRQEFDELGVVETQAPTASELSRPARGQRSKPATPDEEPKFSMRPVRERSESMAPFGLRKGKRYKTREIAVAMQERQREKYGMIGRNDRSPRAARKIANWMVDEVLHELENLSDSAVGWYTEKFQKALDNLAPAFPEFTGKVDRNLPGLAKLKTKQNARDFFTALVAVTSDGQTAAMNLAHASEVYDAFRQTGQFPDVKFGGDRNKSIRTNLKNIIDMLDRNGPSGMHKVLLEADTVSKLRKKAKALGHKFNPDYPAGEQLPYSAVLFGDKLGAFYANLMGETGYLTMDRWWSRTFNRYRGTILASVPGRADSPTDSKGNKVGLARFKEMLGRPEMSDDEAILETIPLQKSYFEKDFKNGTDIEKTANDLYKKAFIALEDSPFNTSDRGFMIDATRRAQRSLKRQGHNITTADLQAILWYYEKRLYAELGARETADESYEEVAERLAEQNRKHGGWRPTATADARDSGRGSSGDRDGGVGGQAEGRFNLYVAHNLSESNLHFANDLGGLAAPSLAIARADKGFDTFGEITLLADPALLQDRKARTFDADIYSSRQPRPEYSIEYGKWKAFEESLGELHGLSRPDMDAAQRGPEDMARNPAVKLGFLREIGKAPKTKKRTAPPEIKKAAALGLSGPNEIRTDPRVQALAERFYRKDHQKSIDGLVEGGMSRSEAESLMADTFFEDDGSLKRQLMQRFPMEVWSYQRDGGIDVAAFEKAINKAMRPKLVQQRYENWIRKKHGELHTGARLFKGFSPSGKRKYSPYTLDNVLREMVKKLQGGEGFNYGPGSVRAMYAQEIRSLKEAQNRRDQIVTEDEMNQIRSESGDRVAGLLEELKPYYRYDADGFGYFDDAMSALAEGRKGWNEAFDLDAEATQKIVDVIEYLRGLPTQYFESKLNRAVGIEEFHTAVVPKDASKETVELLRRKGLEVVKYNPDQDGARREAIAQQEALLFSQGRGRQAAQTLDPAATQQAFNEIAKGMTSPILVHASPASASRSAGIDIPETANGFFYKGKVHVIASAHTTLADAEGTLWHEILHAGVARLFKGETKAYMQAMGRLRLRNANLRRAAAEWQRLYGQELLQTLEAVGITGESAEARVVARATEEALADMSKAEGRAPKLQGLRKFINTIVQFMRKHGFTALPDAIERMTDAEALHTIMAARQAVSEGNAQMLFGRPIGIRESRIKPKRDALGFHSGLSRAIQQSPTNLDGAKAKQWKSWIFANAGKLGAKKEEIQWSGVMEWLDLQEGPVAAEDIQEYLDIGGVQVEEVVLGTTGLDEGAGFYIEEHGGEWAIFREGEDSPVGGTFRTEADAEVALESMAEEDKPSRYAEYTIPGGENYREVLLKLPEANRLTEAENRRLGELQRRDDEGETLTPKEEAERVRLNEKAGQWAIGSPGQNYRSSHWDVTTPNVLAHLRVDDRTGPNGERILFVQEVQSDWGQQGRREGFGRESMSDDRLRELIEQNDANADTEGLSRAELLELAANSGVTGGPIPAAPFVTNTKGWVNLALKRLMVMAADGGYDQVAFATGEQSAELYSLDTRLSEINYRLVPNDHGLGRAERDLYSIEVVDISGRVVQDASKMYYADEIEATFGKEIAQKIVDGVGEPETEQRRKLTEILNPEATGSTVLKGDNLKLEAKGMRDFYDRIVPQVARKVIKPLRGRAGHTEMLVPVKDTGQFDRAFLRAAESMRESGMSREDAMEAMRRSYLDASENEIQGAVTLTYGGTPSNQFTIYVTPEMAGQITKEGLPLFSLRTRKPPKNTVKAYKLFEVRDGKLYPLFIGATQEVPFGRWLDADADNLVWAEGFRRPNGKKAWKLFQGDRNAQPTEQDFQTHELRIMAVGKGNQLFAPRPGWHLGESPSALHIGAKVPGVAPLSGKNDAPTHRKPTQVWAEVEVAADVDWQAEANRRAGRYKSGPRKGQIKPKEAEIRDELPTDGFYQYKTNSNMEGDWIITGAMKVNRVLTQDEVDTLNQEAGTQDLPRQKPLDLEALGLAESPKFSRLPATLTVNGKQRPTTNSEGRPIHPTAEGVKAFYEWFGDSAVVDAEGRPKVVYHGTRAEIDAFDSDQIGQSSGNDGYYGSGFYFSASQRMSEPYADGEGGNIVPAYVRIESPMVFTDQDGTEGRTEMIASLDGWTDQERSAIRSGKSVIGESISGSRFTEVLRQNGYDGVIVDGWRFAVGGGTESVPMQEVVAFDESQIKSSVGNQGTFDPANPDIRFSRPVLERQEKAQGAIAKGQPIDRVFRFLFDVTGTLDASGRFKPGVKLDEAVRKAITEWRPADDGVFGWMNPMIAKVRAGLIDRYGLSQEFLQREFESQAEASTILGVGEKFLKELASANVGPAEARILQNILNGEDVGDANMRQLAAPIRQAIDDLGQEMVSLGLLPAETYHRNLGQYLHRSYLKYEHRQDGLPKWRQNIMRKHRRKIHGDELKARGLKEDVTTERLLRDLPPDWWGRKLEKGEADKQLVNTEWKILDLVRVPGEGSGQLDGVDVTPSKPHTLRRVFWPVDMPVPDSMAEYSDRGTWKVTGTKGNKLRLRRDFTKAERDAMGEVLDARYNILRTFQMMSHDIANGRFFSDIAKNPEWATAQPPSDSEVGKPKEAAFMKTYAEFDWIQVPDSKITGTGVHQWGALAGMYVRPEIWRDLNELDRMQHAGTWRELLTQWKINKTARSPVVHMNNVMSNFVLMDLIDVRMQDLVRGIAEYRQGGEMFLEAREHGAFGVGFVRQELHRNFVEPLLDEILQDARDSRDTVDGRARFLSKMGYAIWNKIKQADRKMVDMYQLEDEIFRMATFMRHRSMGASAEEAAMIAREQFLNYDIRAPWVNAFRRTVLPFISYTYRAVPAITQAIMHRPWKLAKYATMGYLANLLAFELAPGDEDEERRTMRDSQQGMTWASLPFTDIGFHRMMRMPWKDQHDNPYYIDIFRWIPAGDVFDTNQGQLPVPAWLQFGGPVQLAFEMALNRSGFTGQDIVDRDIDTLGQAAEKRAGYLWKAWMPSAAYVPGSWHFDKASAAIQGERDILGRAYNIPAAFASGVGIKVQPHDVQLGYYYRGNEIERKLRAVKREARQIEKDAARGIGNPVQRRRDLERVQQKAERLEEKARILRGQ